MLGVALWWLYDANHRFVTSTDLAGEQMADIRLEMFVDESFKIQQGDYEKPENIRYREYLVFEDYAVGPDLQNNEVVYIETESPEIETSKGIKVANSIDKEIQVQ